MNTMRPGISGRGWGSRAVAECCGRGGGSNVKADAGATVPNAPMLRVTCKGTEFRTVPNEPRCRCG